jgi:hypothetical protein
VAKRQKLSQAGKKFKIMAKFAFLGQKHRTSWATMIITFVFKKFANFWSPEPFQTHLFHEINSEPDRGGFFIFMS